MKHKSWIILIMLFSLTTGAIAQNSSIKIEKKATKLIEIGNLHINQGRSKEAEINYKEALKIYRKLARKNPTKFNPEVAITLHNLAHSLINQRYRYTAAEAKYKEALNIYKKLAKNNPKFHSEIDDTLDHLDELYKIIRIENDIVHQQRINRELLYLGW